jgi:hypothetical protein
MRKKREVLRDIAYPAEARRKMHASFGIAQYMVVHFHFPGDRPAQARDRFKERSFPGAGRTENAGDRTVEDGVDFQSKVAQGEPNLLQVQVHRGRFRVEII